MSAANSGNYFTFVHDGFRSARAALHVCSPPLTSPSVAPPLQVRFSPNMCSHAWVASAGQSGLVRINCLRAMVSSQTEKIIDETRDQFAALYSPKDAVREQEAQPAGGSPAGRPAEEGSCGD